jgi:UDP-glucose 4-epimerase
MKILVTGASGFVGGRFVRDFQDKYEIQTVSLRRTSVQDLNFSGVEVIIHCAALVHQMKGAPRENYFKVNYELTRDLALQAQKAGVKHFIFLSTAHVYGVYGDMENFDRLLSESTPCHPLDAYGESKLEAEIFLRSIETPDFIVSVIRPPLVYGEGAKGNLLSLVKLIRRIPALPFKYNKNRRSLIYVGNLALVIHLTIQKRLSGIFLPQNEKALSIEELTAAIANSIHRKVWLFRPPSGMMWFLKKFVPHYTSRLYGSLALDSSTSNEKLDYHPYVTNEEGLRRTNAL